MEHREFYLVVVKFEVLVRHPRKEIRLLKRLIWAREICVLSK